MKAAKDKALTDKRWYDHIPTIVFTGACIALTILHYRGMAIYFAVMSFLAFGANCNAVSITTSSNKENT